MHYYIDGYNLLFRLLQAGEDLKQKRKDVIEILEAKASELLLDITVVFDSHYQEDESTRNHYKSLEIIFTATRETADEFILHALKEVKNPKEHTVVTSDKTLARLSKIRLANTETIEEFLSWVGKRCKNKNKSQPLVLKELTLKTVVQDRKTTPDSESKNSDNLPSPTTISKLIRKEPPPQPPPQSIPQEKISAEGCFDYYLSAFEKESKSLEKANQAKPSSSKKEKSQKKPKAAPLSEEDRYLSDMARWQRAFEKKSSNPT
ncbi:MAG: NYN domain-containing protein [Parachlamydiaceae bacterium]